LRKEKIHLAKHVLHNDPDEFNFLLFGIASSENQYVLASSINSALGIDLQLSDYIDLSHRMGKDFKFSFYNYLDEEFNLEYNLIPNKSNNVAKEDGAGKNDDLFSAFNENVDESSRLIPELTKTDYLLLIKGDEHYNFTYKITDALKKINEIISLQEIVPDKLSNKNNLIF
jgi:hypothetical protein